MIVGEPRSRLHSCRRALPFPARYPPKNYVDHQHNETSTSDHRSALRLTYGDDCIRRLEHSSLRTRLSTELKFLTHQTAAHLQAAGATLEQPSTQPASTTEPSERFLLE